MDKEQLETNIAALELLVNETTDKSKDFQVQLEQAKQDLADINKPILTPMQLDDVYEAVEKAVDSALSSYELDCGHFDYEFEMDYENRIQLNNLSFTDTYDLAEAVIVNIERHFKIIEKLNTTKSDNHKVTHVEKII